MINIDRYIPNELYYAAANSFYGFVSYFDKVFNRERFKKLYILKGGPGTGKSTILKGLVSYANSMNYHTVAIPCSSDTNSLDGVIISTERGIFGALDGTAPHTTDPIYPGAVDEIINLGTSFDICALEAKREEIIELNKRKAEAYRSAYKQLSDAGKAFHNIISTISTNEIYYQAEYFAKLLFNELSSSDNSQNYNVKTVSSFSKKGYMLIPIKQDGKRIISINGDRFIVAITIRILADMLKNKSLLTTLSPSCLDPEYFDRIETKDTIIVNNEVVGDVYELGDLISEYGLDIQELEGRLSSVLDASVYEFARASESHFELENIYSKAMNFNANEKVYEMLCEKMTLVLS